VSMLHLWPTKVMIVELTPEECHDHNIALHDLVTSQTPAPYGLYSESKLFGMEKINHSSINWLINHIKVAASAYIGGNYSMNLTMRGVAIHTGRWIVSHTETHESDLMIAYWPGGDASKIGTNPNETADRMIAPTMVLEDPSRRYSDLRLPFEVVHSFHISPRPGLLIIGPAHLPHNLWPYAGNDPFVHIVAQVKIDWPEKIGEF
jgi:hypothetical protein